MKFKQQVIDDFNANKICIKINQNDDDREILRQFFISNGYGINTYAGSLNYYFKSTKYERGWDCSLEYRAGLAVVDVKDILLFNEELVQQLREGKIVLVNDGKLAQLTEVLNYALPDDVCEITGRNLFYQADNNSNGWLSYMSTSFPPNKRFSLHLFYNKKENKMKIENRFPFSLSATDQKRIFDAACHTWKTILAEQWAKTILFQQSVPISEEFYKQMRAACTEPQHKLFDEIFGKDEDVLPEGTPCLIKLSSYGNTGYFFRYADGKGSFFVNGKKSGKSLNIKQVSAWQVLDVNNLPVEE